MAGGRRSFLGFLGGVALSPGVSQAAGNSDVAQSYPATFAALRGRGHSEGFVVLQGREHPGDGGGGLFQKLDSAHPGVDDDVTLIVDASGAAWRREFTGGVDVRWAGARSDGVADDTMAVSRAARAGAIVFAAGETRVSGRLMIDVFADVRPGATIRLSTGARLHFCAGFNAEITEVFRGDGIVEFDRAKFEVGHPEWWGARINDPAFDNASAIQACLDAAPVTLFMGGDYYYSRELVVSGSNRLVQGLTSNQDGTPGGTRLMLTSPVGHGMLLGSEAQPGPPVGLWTEHTTVKNFAIKRALAPVAPSSSGLDINGAAAAPTGFRIKYVVSCFVENIVCYDHTNGFYIQGAVHSYLRYCQTIRAYGPAAPEDYFFGFLQNNGILVGFASGNASLYYQSCTVIGSQAFLTGVGLRAYGGFSDTFVMGMETALCPTGMEFLGISPTDSSYSAENLHISQCILDGCVFNGIVVKAGNAFSAVTISDCYVAQGGGPASAAIQIAATKGAVTLANNQLLSEPGTNSPAGIRVINSEGVSTRDNIVTDFSAPVIFEKSSFCRSADTVNNVHQATAVAAVSFIKSTRCSAAMIVKGSPDAAGRAGVSLDSLSSYIEVNVSGIDPSSLQGVASNTKLMFDRVSINDLGPFGDHNLAVGIM